MTMTASAGQQLFLPRLAFAASGALALGTSGIIFRDLADFSHWFHKPNRNEVMATFRKRHEITKAYFGATLTNLALYMCRPALANKRFVPFFHATTFGLWFTGAVNPFLMMRPRNHNALYVSTCDSRKILKPTDWCVVTRLEDQEPVAYPDKQISRPHIARVGTMKDGTPAAVAFCALTGTGVVVETPDLPDGRPREFVPYIQLENNLVVLDMTTGHFAHQLNLVDESNLLKKMGETDAELVKRRPKNAELERLGVKPAKEIASWRMTVENFTEAFPHGKVFINDYREFSDLKKPVLTMYDKFMDLVFDVFLGHHNVSPKPLFPTVDNIDPRLHAKTRVWGFNVGDEYVAVTEDFVKEKNRNMTVGDTPLVASWDPDTESLGIFVRPSRKPISGKIDVHGKVKGSKDQTLDRLNTVKPGLYWFAWANFYPSTALNPTQ